MDRLPTTPEALAASEMLTRQHHQPSCPGCVLCLTGTHKPDRSYPNAEELDLVGRTLGQGT